MTALPKQKMSVDEFLDWAVAQPEGRFELVRGEVVSMAAERVRHVVVKLNVARALQDAARAVGSVCTVLGDGVIVRIDLHTSYEPDATIVCGQEIDLDSVVVENPLVVVEVTSPSSEKNDASGKLADYLTLPSIAHVLIVDPVRKIVMHHARGEGADVLTRILREADMVSLEPPGLKVEVNAFFEGV